MQKQELLQLAQKLGINKNDAESVILCNTGLSKNQYFLLDKIDNSEDIILNFERISDGYPIQYVTYSCEFYGREFYIDTSVLIPRIDTELMIDVLKGKKYGETAQYIDLGTGSGIIAISLAKEIGRFGSMYALDISSNALRVAKKNIKRHDLEKSINVVKSNFLSSFDDLELDSKKPLVIAANLPYIRNKDYGNMSSSTIEYEPDLALYGGINTGFEIYEELISQVELIQQKGYDIELFIEIGFDQRETAEKYLLSKNLYFEFHRDSATIERVVEIHF